MKLDPTSLDQLWLTSIMYHTAFILSIPRIVVRYTFLMDTASKWLAVFLIVYALLGIGHLLMKKKEKPPLDVQIETVASTTTE